MAWGQFSLLFLRYLGDCGVNRADVPGPYGEQSRSWQEVRFSETFESSRHPPRYTPSVSKSVSFETSVLGLNSKAIKLAHLLFERRSPSESLNSPCGPFGRLITLTHTCGLGLRSNGGSVTRLASKPNR